MKALEKNCIKYQLIVKHRELVKSGDLITAKVLLSFLRKNRITLGLGDADNAVERILENVGLRPSYGRNFNTASFSM